MKDLKKEMIAFRKRWDILEEKNEQELFLKFKNGVLNATRNIYKYLSPGEILRFCSFFGRRAHSAYSILTGKEGEIGKNIYDKLEKDKTDIELYESLQLLFSLDWEDGRAYINFFHRIKEVIDYSTLDIGISLNKNTHEVILYPTEEQRLDEELVDFVLSFLSEQSNKHYVEALQFYQIKKYEKCAESLRRSLEEFLKEKLKNKKGLHENILEIGRLIKQNSSPEIRNVIQTTFNYLDNYFNAHSKHNDGVSGEDAEYLIYQIALLMRYIYKVIIK